MSLISESKVSKKLEILSPNELSDRHMDRLLRREAECRRRRRRRTVRSSLLRVSRTTVLSSATWRTIYLSGIRLRWTLSARTARSRWRRRWRCGLSAKNECLSSVNDPQVFTSDYDSDISAALLPNYPWIILW